MTLTGFGGFCTAICLMGLLGSLWIKDWKMAFKFVLVTIAWFWMTVLFAHIEKEEAEARSDYQLHSTYATCYALPGFARDGTPVYRRMAASNFLRSGTKIRLVGPQAGPGGIRKYVVHDTGPALADGHLDLWHPSRSYCLNRFGVRSIKYKFGWGRP